MNCQPHIVHTDTDTHTDRQTNRQTDVRAHARTHARTHHSHSIDFSKSCLPPLVNAAVVHTAMLK